MYLEKKYRIYKDVRFSKDKSPYKPRFAVGLQKTAKEAATI
jgi:uncharacterized protein (DUF2461 family)